MSEWIEKHGLKYRVHLAHINQIAVGDTVEHAGELMTVSRSSLQRDAFMGLTLWGDSYHMGHKPVRRVEFFDPLKSAA